MNGAALADSTGNVVPFPTPGNFFLQTTGNRLASEHMVQDLFVRPDRARGLSPAA